MLMFQSTGLIAMQNGQKAAETFSNLQESNPSRQRNFWTK